MQVYLITYHGGLEHDPEVLEINEELLKAKIIERASYDPDVNKFDDDDDIRKDGKEVTKFAEGLYTWPREFWGGIQVTVLEVQSAKD